MDLIIHYKVTVFYRKMRKNQSISIHENTPKSWMETAKWALRPRKYPQNVDGGSVWMKGHPHMKKKGDKLTPVYLPFR